MRYFKWLGLAGALLLIVACFLPWIYVESKQLTVTGVSAPGTTYGKPGYLNLLLTLFFIIFSLIPRVWAKRSNLLVVAVNMAWAIRNVLLLSACHGGECPQRKTGLLLVIAGSLLMMLGAFFPGEKLLGDKNT